MQSLYRGWFASIPDAGSKELLGRAMDLYKIYKRILPTEPPYIYFHDMLLAILFTSFIL
jgi:hypothetical protein